MISQLTNIPNPKTQGPKEFSENTTTFFNEVLPTFVNETNDLASDINDKYIDIYSKWIAVTNQAIDGGYSQSYLDSMFAKIWNGLTFYVDAENGDDNNDGSSDSPFKTIQKAVYSVPIGGKSTIELLSNIDIYEPVYINNKTISILSKKIVTLHTRIINDKRDIANFRVNYANLNLSYIAFKVVDETDSDASFNAGTDCCILANNSNINYWYDTSYDDLDIDYFIDLVVGHFVRTTRGIASEINKPSSFNIAVRNNSAKIKLDGGLLVLSYGSVIANFYIACDILDNDGNDLTLTDVVLGIAKDADSGNPINILSNKNFSD